MDQEDLGVLRTNSPDDVSNNYLLKAYNVIYVEGEDEETVAIMKRYTTCETLKFTKDAKRYY